MHQGMKRDNVLETCGISKHQFYHQPSGKKPGRKVTKTTVKSIDDQKVMVPNAQVIEDIREILKNPLADYGYHRMCGELTLMGYYINHKKVYRLMKKSQLLQPKREAEAKNYVKYRVLCPEGPLRLLEMDIKMVWIEGLRRYGFILTLLDVFTRVVLHWELGFQMRQADVQRAWTKVIEQHLEPNGAKGWETHIEIRSDNGPQFCATKLNQFFEDNYLMRTFTHPYTPQENGHIESFHAILGRALKAKYFADLAQLHTELEEFYLFYNYERIHGSTLKLPPMTFWDQWEKGNVTRTLLEENQRKVRFSLNIQRQEIVRVRHTDIESLKGVSSLDLLGLDAPANPSQNKENQHSQNTNGALPEGPAINQRLTA